MNEIAAFQPRDLPAVMALAARTLPEEYPYDFFLQMARLQGRYFRVARDVRTGNAVGFIVANREPGLEANVLLLAVDPAHQGQGLGRALLRDVERHLALADVRSLRLEVRPDNRRAIRFYQHHGFAVAGLQEGAYKDGSDALWMSKPLR